MAKATCGSTSYKPKRQTSAPSRAPQPATETGIVAASVETKAISAMSTIPERAFRSSTSIA